MSVFDSLEYEGWRKNRLAWLNHRYGLDRLRGRKVLCLGDGVGHVSLALQSHGADVTHSDGRSEHCEEARRRGVLRSVVYNVEDPWPDVLDSRFDLVIHWGLLYHTVDQNAALECMTHTDECCLESEVFDSRDPLGRNVRGEAGPDQAASAHSCGTHATAESIEHILYSRGCTYDRVLDPVLNGFGRNYTWRVGDNVSNPRRFWWVLCPAAK